MHHASLRLDGLPVDTAEHGGELFPSLVDLGVAAVLHRPADLHHKSVEAVGDADIDEFLEESDLRPRRDECLHRAEGDKREIVDRSRADAVLIMGGKTHSGIKTPAEAIREDVDARVADNDQIAVGTVVK